MNPPPLIIGNPAPLLGNRMQHEPFLLNLGMDSTLPLGNQSILQLHIDTLFALGYRWGMAPYLEYRAPLLSIYPQMVSEQRFYHLGIDVVAPLGTILSAPLAGTVYQTGYEEGDGNYGGFVVLEHTDDHGTRFFVLYGHLDTSALPPVHEQIAKGAAFARMGNRTCNGGWFIHTHVQVLTQRALAEGWLHRGYCSRAQLTTITALCPDPAPLLSPV